MMMALTPAITALNLATVWAVSISQVPNLSKRQKWKGFKTIVMVRRNRTLWNDKTDKLSYYISSLEADAALIAHSIRAHWSVENSLHWVERCDLQGRPKPDPHGSWTGEYGLAAAIMCQFAQTPSLQR